MVTSPSAKAVPVGGSSASVVKVAWPVPSRATLPRVVVPSRKSTAPVGAATSEWSTVAVKVARSPGCNGTRGPESAIAVAPGPGSGVGSCALTTSTGDALVANVAAPVYATEIECAPTTRPLALSTACPEPSSTCVPSTDVASRNSTEPVGVPLIELTLAVMVSASPVITGLAFTENVASVAMSGSTVYGNTGEVAVEYLASPR